VSKVLYVSDERSVADNQVAISKVHFAFRKLSEEMHASLTKSCSAYIATRSLKEAVERMEDATAQLRACIQRDDPLFKYRGDQAR
jgi:hypothetical protein